MQPSELQRCRALNSMFIDITIIMSTLGVTDLFSLIAV